MLATKVQVPREGRTTAVITYVEDGALHSETVTVIYRPLSAATQRDFMDEIFDERNGYKFADYVAKLVISIPELLDEQGQPVLITSEFAWNMTIENLRAIHDAIEADQHPKEIASSSPAG